MKNILIIILVLCVWGCADDTATDATTEPETQEMNAIEERSVDGDFELSDDEQNLKVPESEVQEEGTGDETATETEGALSDSPFGDELPKAKVYKNNPLDNGTITVDIEHLTDPDGYLTGKYAKVWNCTKEDGGKEVDLGGFSLTLCNQKQTVLPEDGNYLHITPAQSDDGSDEFAELMMYYHVNFIHDYFKEEHGMSFLDFPLTAIVNVQANLGFLGGWFPFDNAAFIPEESFAQFPFPLEVGQGGAIIFGQGESVDYAYEVDVIYHEYTHAMVGTTRLSGFVRDEFGPDNTPGAMNEGFADYFATTITGDPVMGEYALSNISGMMGDGPGIDLRRDLSKLHVCPKNLTTEVHADGLIVGNALWTIRENFGRKVTDAMILNALGTFNEDTNFTKAAEAIIAEAEFIDEETGNIVRGIFEERGLLGCDRVMDYTGTIIQSGGGALPFTIPGTQETDIVPFSSYTPSYMQWRIPVDKDTQSMTVEMSGQAGGGLGGFGGFGGGGQEDPLISLAIKPGRDAILYTYDGTKPAEHDAWEVLPMVSGPGQQGLVEYSVTFNLPCDFSDDSLVIQFHTTSPSGVAGLILDVDQSDMSVEGTACGEDENDESNGLGEQTLLQVLGDNPDTETLTTAVELTDLAGLLDDPSAEYTLFAPTNEAFDALPEGLLESLLADKGKLSEILFYHAIQGVLLAEEVINLTAAETLAGNSISIQLEDGNVLLNGTTLVVSTNIQASNGVIHIIDEVLTPPGAERTQ